MWTSTLACSLSSSIPEEQRPVLILSKTSGKVIFAKFWALLTRSEQSKRFLTKHGKGTVHFKEAGGLKEKRGRGAVYERIGSIGLSLTDPWQPLLRFGTYAFCSIFPRRFWPNLATRIPIWKVPQGHVWPRIGLSVGCSTNKSRKKPLHVSGEICPRPYEWRRRLGGVVAESDPPLISPCAFS